MSRRPPRSALFPSATLFRASGSVVVIGSVTVVEVVRGRVSEVVETRPSVVVVGSGGSVTVVVVRGGGSVVVIGSVTAVEGVRWRVSEVVETRPSVVVVGSGG